MIRVTNFSTSVNFHILLSPPRHSIPHRGQLKIERKYVNLWCHQCSCHIHKHDYFVRHIHQTYCLVCNNFCPLLTTRVLFNKFWRGEEAASALSLHAHVCAPSESCQPREPLYILCLCGGGGARQWKWIWSIAIGPQGPKTGLSLFQNSTSGATHAAAANPPAAPLPPPLPTHAKKKQANYAVPRIISRRQLRLKLVNNSAHWKHYMLAVVGAGE